MNVKKYLVIGTLIVAGGFAILTNKETINTWVYGSDADNEVVTRSPDAPETSYSAPQ